MPSPELTGFFESNLSQSVIPEKTPRMVMETVVGKEEKTSWCDDEDHLQK
jgi:hypothetical protein